MKYNRIREKNYELAEIRTILGLLGIDSESFNTMLGELPVTFWVRDENHKIVYANQSFQENFGACQKQTCHQCLMGEGKVCSCCPTLKEMGEEQPDRCKLCKRGESGYDLNVFHTPIINKEGRKFVLTSSLHIKDFAVLTEGYSSETSDMDGRKNFLVMCASCKKVKDTGGNWMPVDNHIAQHFNVPISHGICPECVEVLYPMLNMQGSRENVRAK